LVVSLCICIEGVVLCVILNVDSRSKVIKIIVVWSIIRFRNDECINISVFYQFAIFRNGLVNYALVGLCESRYIGRCKQFDGLFQEAINVVLRQIVAPLVVGHCLPWYVGVFNVLWYWSLDTLKDVCRNM